MNGPELIETISFGKAKQELQHHIEILYDIGIAGVVYQEECCDHTHDEYCSFECKKRQWYVMVFDKNLMAITKKCGVKGCAMRQMKYMMQRLKHQLDCDWLNHELPKMSYYNYRTGS